MLDTKEDKYHCAEDWLTNMIADYDRVLHLSNMEIAYILLTRGANIAVKSVASNYLEGGD